jgi:Ni/Co efflux regulator RcnB
MKKFITLALLLTSVAFSATFASAQTYFPQQDRNDQNRRDDRRDDRRNDWRRERIETQTRIVRKGNKVFRETVQIKYKRNGKVETKVISRTRIR